MEEESQLCLVCDLGEIEYKYHLVIYCLLYFKFYVLLFNGYNDSATEMVEKDSNWQLIWYTCGLPYRATLDSIRGCRKGTGGWI